MGKVSYISISRGMQKHLCNIYLHINIYTYTHIRLYEHIYISISISIYLSIYIYTYVHIYIYIYISNAPGISTATLRGPSPADHFGPKAGTSNPPDQDVDQGGIYHIGLGEA